MLESKVLDTIKKYNLIKENDKIVVGVSGGPDSITLLNILNKLSKNMNFEICVAHINHMIRKEADEETEYVKDFCKKINVQCFVKKADVLNIADTNKEGTEETGRKVRYDFFEEIRKKTNSNKIATAHNSNDNAETVLMNIIRGSGSSGLKGIEPIRGNIIRPLIECNREEIEAYCDDNNLEPKFDKSNKENIYTRNKIRNLLIPYLKDKFNPNIIEAINRLSILSKEENEYLESVVQVEFEKILLDKKENEVILDLKKFNELDKVIRSRIILFTINMVLGTNQGIEKTNIEDILVLCSNNIGNKFLMPNKNIKVLVKDKKIYFKSMI